MAQVIVFPTNQKRLAAMLDKVIVDIMGESSDPERLAFIRKESDRLVHRYMTDEAFNASINLPGSVTQEEADDLSKRIQSFCKSIVDSFANEKLILVGEILKLEIIMWDAGIKPDCQ